MKKKIFSIILSFLIIISLLPLRDSNAQSSETITGRQRDTLLLMTGKENPNYDICIVIDISGSMGSVLEKFKVWAAKVVESSINNDTLVLVRFDHFTRKPLIQQVKSQRDKDLFMGWLRKIETTQGFGTDIRSAYLQGLKVLNEMNEARRKKGEPIRLQYIVFVSDGDDIPPAKSPFRNPGSKESLELDTLIDKTRKEKLIDILPIGMEFKNYQPIIKTHDPGHVPDKTAINDPELQKFLTRMKDVLQRSPSGSTGSVTEKFPKQDYQFNIDWLSNKISLVKLSETKGEERNTRILNYALVSDFKSVELDNLTVSGVYTNTSGELEGKIVKGPKILSTVVKPGDRAQIEVTIRYPQNWSFKDKKSSGNLMLTVGGDMKVEVEEEVQPTPGPRPSITLPPSPAVTVSPSPTASPKIKTKKVALTYPFNTITRDEAVSVNLPIEKSLFLYAGLGLIAVVLIPLLFIYSVIVPITVTVKMGEKARVFRLVHGGNITIGGNADFPIDGCSEVVAEIQRKFRRFVLIEKVNGTFPESQKNPDGKIALKISDGFSLNVAGSYKEFEFLPGNQEFADEETDDFGGADSSYDSGPEEYDSGDFKF